MSESALPEDLSLWPKSPYQLLGVTPGTAERDVRRAYTRLIRIWKPEQFPEHFRRIRDAYEALLRFPSSFEGHAIEEPVAAGPAKEARAVPQVSGAVDELGETWQLALAGHIETAYRQFVELDQHRPGRVDVTLRLYWLLKIQRDTDLRRVPCDWLVQGLLNNGATGPLRELYLRELADDPAEAKSSRCDRVMSLPITAGRLADLADARWAALVKLDAWDQLAGDVESLRERIAREDEQAWLRLVVNLAERVAWVQHASASILLSGLRREIKRLEHLAVHFPAEFDRADALFRATTAWSALFRFNLPSALLRLIRQSWTQPFAEVRSLLQGVLEQIAANPTGWLQHFSTVQEKSSQALAQFGRLLDGLQQSKDGMPPRPDPGEIVELAQDFFAQANDSYGKIREQVLKFCLREALAPEQMSASVLQRPGDWPTWVLPLAEKIHDDWPLRYVYRAWALFWV